jgi:hypothetical protein
MSVSTEVRRTIVKSPPELWAELSDPEALGRHLGELDGVRITRAEPETLLEWEAEGASGAVQLKASGFGTKVVLSLTRDVSEPAVAAEPEPEPEAVVEEPEPEPVAAVPEPEPVAAEPEPEPVAAEPEPEPEPAPEPEPEPAAAEPESRRGFFARLFRHRRPEQIVPDPQIDATPVIEPEPVTTDEPEPETAEPQADLVAELAAMEAQIAEQATDLLTGVLDRLGAAHHRPFSRG